MVCYSSAHARCIAGGNSCVTKHFINRVKIELVRKGEGMGGYGSWRVVGELGTLYSSRYVCGSFKVIVKQPHKSATKGVVINEKSHFGVGGGRASAPSYPVIAHTACER